MKIDNSYLKLPAEFFQRCAPTPVADPKILIFNDELADRLQVPISFRADAQIWSGNQSLPGSASLAQAYAGHQFGQPNMLGDGRAHLLAEVLDSKEERFDLQLKGSGPTPYSRNGDGRAALGPMLREYLISEAMFALGVPTTRSLAVVSTGEPVFREKPLPGAVLTRVASSHIRVGTFEYAARLNKPEILKTFADYTIQRHYPEIFQDTRAELRNGSSRYQQFLSAVIGRQARLVAQWMSIGFIHGVMNTDNMAISGETIDYGPCAFMDNYHPKTVFSSIDRRGRYAFQNQPGIAKWNLTRLAEALLPLLANSEGEAIPMAESILEKFDAIFEEHWLELMSKKIGFSQVPSSAAEAEARLNLLGELLQWMQNKSLDFTLTFRQLSEHPRKNQWTHADQEMQSWLQKWRTSLETENVIFDLAAQKMNEVNPFVIPRNHQVEKALLEAAEHEDLSHFRKLLAALQSPFVENSEFSQPPPEVDPSYKTFCGT